MALDHSQMRASDSDRDRLRDILTAAFNEGRLTYTEFSDRVDELFAARTYADLERLIEDLPKEDLVPTVTTPTQINTEKTHLSLQGLGWILFSYFLFLLLITVISATGGPSPIIFLVAFALLINVATFARRRRRHRV